MKENKQFDGLILEIRSVLSENRCSYSDSQKAALNECIYLLQEGNFNSSENSKIDWNLICEIIKILTLLYFDRH